MSKFLTKVWFLQDPLRSTRAFCLEGGEGRKGGKGGRGEGGKGGRGEGGKGERGEGGGGVWKSPVLKETP